MTTHKENLEQIKKMFVDSGEYSFKDEKTSNKFIKDVLWKAENQYSSEGYHHKYKELKDFLYTHHVDAIAHWTYQDDYES